MKPLKSQQLKLPRVPGVYIFKDKAGTVLYVGKATVLRTRVAAYFRPDVEPKIAQLVQRATRLDHLETDSTLSALFLEASLIKKYQPLYNSRQKDDKSGTYLVITDETFPRLEITRPTALQKYKVKKSYGPFASKKELGEALKILRRIFPYHSAPTFGKPCFHYQIGLCPGPCARAITKKDYMKNITSLMQIFAGKKIRIEKMLEREMLAMSKAQNFEAAARLRDTLAAIKNHRDITFAAADNIDWKVVTDIPRRLEAYDISNISGEHAVGSMVVFTYGRKDPAEYRKFRIKSINSPDDTGMLKEMLLRRFRNDWPRPALIFIDGGIGQLRAAREVISRLHLKIPVVSAAKGPNRSGFKIFKSRPDLAINRDLLKEASYEAHRFAINYHRRVRQKSLLHAVKARDPQ